MKYTYLKDIVYVVLFTIICYLLFSLIDFFELLIKFSREYEDYEIDEIIILFLLLPLPLLWYAIRRYKEVVGIKKELESINSSLEKRVDEAIKEVEKKNEIINQKLKMTSMTEMLENIAHQWRQPLNSISLSVSGLKLDSKDRVLDDKRLEESLDKILVNSKYLSNTIEDFRALTKADKRQKEFDVVVVLKRAFTIVDALISKKEIKIFFSGEKSLFMHSYENEFLQAFLNILNNSIEAFDSQKIDDNKYIFIEVLKTKNRVIIKYKDSAGGVEKDKLEKVFEPYFTTKHKAFGTGLGLYLTYTIISKNLQGKIDLENCKYEYEGSILEGVLFTLELPIRIYKGVKEKS